MASSPGKSFHCTKYSFIVMLRSLLSLVLTIFSGMRKNRPSSYKGGKVYETEMHFPITLLNKKHEIQYGFCFPWEAPIDRPLSQLFESPFRDHKILV